MTARQWPSSKIVGVIRRHLVQMQEVEAKCDWNIANAYRREPRLAVMETNVKLAAKAAIQVLEDILKEIGEEG